MKKVLGMISFMMVGSLAILAQKSETFKNEEGAIRGYDAVAYFKEGKPVKGNNKFTYSWNGANWNFSNKANLDSFAASPQKYAPQYGGYCAYGTADGHKAPTDPNAWSIVDGKLYLNYNKQVQVMWNKKQKEFIDQANANWPKIKDME